MSEKTVEDIEMEDYIRGQAEKTVKLQRLAQAGQEMENWVSSGNYEFIQQRILNPLEAECFRAIKKVRLTAGAIPNVAKIKGTLEVFDTIAARIENTIAYGKAALNELKTLQDSTQEGE